MQTKFEKFVELNHKKQASRELIETCLDRIGISDTEEEINHFKFLFKKYIEDYAKYSRQAYIAYLEYEVLMQQDSRGINNE